MEIITAYLLMIAVASFFLWRNMRIPWLMNPAVWFVIMQLRMSLGTLPFIDNEQETDILYALIMFSVMFFFILGAELRKILERYHRTVVINWGNAPVIAEQNSRIDFLMMSIAITAIIVSVIYYYMIGYNVLIDGIKQIFSGEGYYEAWDARRLQMYAGEEYFAPGYVNQFKNILLPLICIYFIVTGMILSQRKRVFLGLLLSIFSFVFVVGTGQRGALMFAMAMIFIFIMNTLRIDRWKVSVFVFILAFSGFSVLTFLLGRNVMEGFGISDSFLYVGLLLKRIFLENQNAGFVGFNYIQTLPTSWGREWLDSLLSLLPNVRLQDTISSRIHAILYGSDQGTSPLTLVGDLWYNFHLLGVTIVPFIIGYIYESVFLGLVKQTKRVFTILIYSALAFILGSWSVGDIRAPFDQGLATIIIFYFLGTYFPKINLHVVPQHSK